MKKRPLVTVGIPIFNESKFISDTLDSILAQDHEHIEIIISDNHSTDNTESICKRYSLKHKHIHYHRLEKNLGPTENFKHVLNLANGEYFMWAAGHDLWTNNYISSCLNLLITHPNAMIASGVSRWISDNGNMLDREYGWVDTRGMDVIARYFTVLWGNMHPIYGLHRRKALQKCKLPNIVGTDLVLLTSLALKGDFLNASNACWYRREVRSEPSYHDKLKRYKSNDYALAKSTMDKIAPLSRLPFELIKGIIYAGIPLQVRILILLLLIPTFPVRYLSGKYKR
jgi:glycosyltransferase involved in cell wall biosynthesis